MSMLARVTKLEGRHQIDAEIPVWCDKPEDVPSVIGEMIACGEIAETDRSRCVYWAAARTGAGSHERALRVLS